MSTYDPAQTIDKMNEKFAGREFLAVVDVADYLTLSPKTVTNLIHRGDLPAFRFGNKFKIPRDGFKVYLESASA